MKPWIVLFWLSSWGISCLIGCTTVTEQYGGQVFNVPLLSIDLTQRNHPKDEKIEIVRVAFNHYLVNSGFIRPDHIWQSFADLAEAYNDRGPGGGKPPYVFCSLTKVAGGPLHLNITVPISINRAKDMWGLIP